LRASKSTATASTSRLDPRNRDNYLFEQGWANTKLGRYEEAIPAFKRCLAVHPDIFWTHLFLAVDYIELGHDDTARTEAAEVLRLNPQFKLDMMFPTVGPKGKVLAEQTHWSADLRKAGLN
jgi:tetratricopeptide (TPR) repeat protein